MQKKPGGNILQRDKWRTDGILKSKPRKIKKGATPSKKTRVKKIKKGGRKK